MDSPVAWDQVQTVLLDMDGTLLDLAFDNFFWRELIPAEFARHQSLPMAAAREQVFALYQRHAGTLSWYCLDHWEATLGLDVVGLKRAHLARVRLLPGVEDFLSALAAAGLPRVIATNAHGTTLALKLEQSGLGGLVDEVHTSHEHGAAKEEQAFWRAFQRARGFDPERTVLIDDNPQVLDAAAQFGVGQCVAILQPDSTRGPQADRENSPHASVSGVACLTEALLAYARGRFP